MRVDFQSEKPIYLQIAGEIEDAIFTGAFGEETQVPSTTDISQQLAINPATVLKGMNLLVEEGILYKRRGLGMFVQEGAVEAVRAKREAHFAQSYLRPMLREARKLGLSLEDIEALLRKDAEHEHD